MLRFLLKLKPTISRSPLPAVRYMSGSVTVDKSQTENLSSPRSDTILSKVNSLKLEKMGIDRFIEAFRTSTLLLKPVERVESFDNLWSLLFANHKPEINTVNRYLFARTDCGLEVNPEEILNFLQEKGVSANSRTYSALVHQCCSKGEMDNTGNLLRMMKTSGLRPDAYLLSEILYGYVKAGHPEEVDSTKDILGRMGLWPSVIAYKAMLNAYAELGDRENVLITLKEALDYTDKITQSSNWLPPNRNNFSPTFLIQLYTKLLCSETPSGGTCTEILSQLPTESDLFTRTQSREGMKQLLARGQLNAALDLFRCAAPTSADDRFLLSLARYMEIGNIEREEIVNIWDAAEVSGPRRNTLKRDAIFSTRRQTGEQSVYSKLFKEFPESSKIFELMRTNPPDQPALVHNWIVPYLIHTGHSPQEVIEGIEPQFRTNAAFGCVLAQLAPWKITDQPTSLVPLDDVEKLALNLKSQGYLPVNQFITFAHPLFRRMLNNALNVPEGSTIPPTERLTQMLNILSHAVSTSQLRAVVNQLFEVCLPSPRFPARMSDNRKESEVSMIVDTCIGKDLKFPSNSWFFYYLDKYGVSEKQQELLKLPSFTLQLSTSEGHIPMSKWQRLFALIQQKKVDDAVELIRSLGSSSTSTTATNSDTSVTRSNLMFRFPDPIAEVYKMISDQFNNSQTPSLSPNEFERLFWSAWESHLLSRPARAINQVGGFYDKMSDHKGLADFCVKVSDQLGSLQEILLVPFFMRVLLEHNFTDNMKLLQSLICNENSSLSAFVTSACDLTALSKDRLDEQTQTTLWDPSSPDYWPVQALSKRFQRISHLQKLRTIHNTIENLCRTGSLSHAHTLRVWANHLGLLILPRTNELLIMTAYWTNTEEYSKSFPQWCMSHDLSQHWPTNLDSNSLSELDTLLCDSDQSGSQQKTVAHWLVEHVDSAPTTSSGGVGGPNANWLPTWLVVCQRLYQSGSTFTEPASWFTLCKDWLKVIGPHQFEAQLQDWLSFAPTKYHRAALLLAALVQPHSQSWAVERLRQDPHLFYVMLLDIPHSSLLDKDQESAFVKAIGQLQKTAGWEIFSNALKDPSVENLKAASANLSDQEILNELVAFSIAKISLLPHVASFLQSTKSEILNAFFDQLLSELRQIPRSFWLTRKTLELMQSLSVDGRELCLENQAFIDLVRRVSSTTPTTVSAHPTKLSLLKSILPENIQDSWLEDVRNALNSNDFVSVLDLWNRLEDEKIKQTALTLIAYSIPHPKEWKRIKEFLFTVAEHGDAALLSSATRIVNPLIPPGLSNAYFAVTRVFNNHEQLNWFDRASIRFHKLGSLLQIKVQNSPGQVRKPRFDAMDQLESLVRQPSSQLVELIRKQENAGNLKETIKQIIYGWNVNKKLSLLSALASEGLSAAVDQVLQIDDYGLVPNYAPYGPFAKMISSAKTGNSQEAVDSSQHALRLLSELDQADVPGCFKGPHVDSLFRYWPSDQLDNLQTLMIDAVGRDRTSLLLQLAAVSVNRGHIDTAEKLVQKTGPIPVTFLAGSPRRILSTCELQTTLSYLNQTDPSRMATLFDTCLRNILSTHDVQQQYSNLVSIIRMMTSEPYSQRLQDICQPATANLIKEYTLKYPNLPSDVSKHIESVTPTV